VGWGCVLGVGRIHVLLRQYNCEVIILEVHHYGYRDKVGRVLWSTRVVEEARKEGQERYAP
jgi:hypothetical protein